jgi:hypothetical protein
MDSVVDEWENHDEKPVEQVFALGFCRVLMILLSN